MALGSQERVDAVDVAIIGGGPAGSAAARILAECGYRVLIATKPDDPARGRAESLPPSTRKLLREIGVLDAVDRAGFYRTTGNTVWWGQRQGQVERFDGSTEALGYQVFRPDLDRLLRAHAQAAGACLITDAIVTGVDFDRDSVRIEYQRNGGRHESTTCRFALDCSGRAGVIARRQGLRRQQRGYRNQALVGVWKRPDGWDLPDQTHTIVQTYEDGWGWSIPLSSAVRHVGVIVDGATTGVARGPTFESTYRAEVAKADELNRLTAGGTLVGVWACDASVYSSQGYTGENFLLVGDAAAFIEPLSSFGVKKALASAWVGAIAVHTSLCHPDRREAALGFFSRRERQVYATSLQRSRDYAREAYASHAHPFWALRAGIDIDPAADIDDDALVKAPDVLAAFEVLRESPTFDFTCPGPIRLEKVPVIRGREIALEDALALPEARHAVRFVKSVDLLKLRELACHQRHVPDLFEAYCREHGVVPLPDLLGGLSLLVAKGALVRCS